MKYATFAALAFLIAVTATAAESGADWINSAEAYFATAKERAEWFRINDQAQRDVFKQRYWLMRDPTQGTETNEFRDGILERIRKADQKFSIDRGLIGSLTSQGMLYVVFGPPARVTVNYRTDPDGVSSEGTMQEATWTWDNQRTPRVLQMLNRPHLVVVVMIEPFRRTDTIQTPGEVAHYREMLAAKSVVNESARVAIAPAPLDVAVARLDAPLSEQARAALKNTKPASAGVSLTVADVSSQNGSTVLVTISVPDAKDRTTHLTTYGEVRAGDRVVATLSEPFRTTHGIDAAPNSRSTVLRLDLPPGSYDGSFAVVDDRSGETLLSVVTPVRVVDPQADFALSSILLGGQPTRGTNEIFTFGDIALHPRADRRFSSNESVWYFATLRSKAGAQGVTADLHLRQGGKTVASQSFQPRLDEIAPGTFLFGRGFDLAQLTPGDYTLYLSIRREGVEPEVRRADFQVVP